jgi:hypothetical protein
MEQLKEFRVRFERLAPNQQSQQEHQEISKLCYYDSMPGRRSKGESHPILSIIVDDSMKPRGSSKSRLLNC